MISISCLESKLLNNNNWYGRFQLAPFQKGEGLTVANALRRTLLAEKRAFFICWVDFYNAEIPYSVLTGMRESIFDILLNLKQVTFTSDKILPHNNYSLKMLSNNRFKAHFLSGARKRLLIDQSVNTVLPISKQKGVRRYLKLQGTKNQKRITSQNVFCENQILGKIVNSKPETCLSIFPSDFKKPWLGTRFFSASQNAFTIPKKTSNSTYIGYICAKGPATIYAKNIKLPKGLKCVDPDRYITTLADDGLFYLRFALTTTIQAPSLTDTSNTSNRINPGIKFNRVNLRVFPKTLLNQEIQSGFNTSQISFFQSHSNSLLRLKQEPQTNNYYKQKYALRFLRPHNAKSSTAPYVPTQDPGLYGGEPANTPVYTKREPKKRRGPEKKSKSYNRSAPARDFKQWPPDYTNNLIRKQYLVLTGDTIKQLDFQNTSIIANIQKTCLLNIQIKHYYYKCGRFDRFLFDLIKPFKPDLISTQYKKPTQRGENNKNIFSQDSDWKVLTGLQMVLERQKSNSYLLIDSQRNNVKKAWPGGEKKKHFRQGFACADPYSGLYQEGTSQNKGTRKLSNRFSLQSREKSVKLESQTPNTNGFKTSQREETSLSSFASNFTKNQVTKWKLNALSWSPRSSKHAQSRDTLKWQKIFQSVRTDSIYNYLQKLNTSQATRIHGLLSFSSLESKILLLGSQLVLNNDVQAKWLSTRLASVLKNMYLKSDVFFLNDLWSKENIEKHASQFLFKEFVGPPVNKLVGRLPTQKNSDLTMNNEQTYNNSSIFTLYELYIKKFLNVCFLFQCSKNHILYFLRFDILQNLLLDQYPALYGEGMSSVYLKNVLHYSPFKFGRVYIEKLITKIKFLKQWSFLTFKHKKQINISFVNKKTSRREGTSLSEGTSIFPWVKDSFLMPPKKSPQRRESLYLKGNKTLKYDIHVREFFYSKNSLPRVICPLFNQFNDWFLPAGRPKKTSHLSTRKKNQPNRGDHRLNSVETCTNLRAKPRVSIQQVSYQPVYIFPYQVETNLDKLLLGFNHLNVGRPKQNLKGNSVVLKPIYLNVEQIIYILKQTTRFCKNQRINPVFFNSLTRLKNKTRYPLDYSSLFSNTLVPSRWSAHTESYPFLYNSFYKSFPAEPYRCFFQKQRFWPFFYNMVSPYSGLSVYKARSGFFFKNRPFSKSKINERKTTSPLLLVDPYFIDAKTPMSNTSYTQKPSYYHVRILGNNFVFKMAPPENKCLAFSIFERVRSSVNKTYPGKETHLFSKQTPLFPLPENTGATGFLAPSNHKSLDGKIAISNQLNGEITEEKRQVVLETDAELGLRTRNQFLIDYEFLNSRRKKKQLVSYSSNMNKDLNHFFLASSLFSNYFPFVTIKDQSKLKSLANEPYNVNTCHSIIGFNLRYMYPFKSTIFETRLPFLNGFNSPQRDFKTSKRIYNRLKNGNLAVLDFHDFFSAQGLKTCTGYHNFDYIQYNESFKIYTSLAYTCLKTYEPNLPKYHNFNRRNQKRFQNNGSKIVSFQLFQRFIQDWAFFQASPTYSYLSAQWGGTQKNKYWIFNTKNKKSYHGKSNAYSSLIRPCEGDQLPTILNSTSRWRIMNTSHFNDAFIVIPCTWFLNFRRDSVYGSRDPALAGNSFSSFVLPLQKLFYMNYTAQNQNENEKVFFEWFGEKKEIVKNKLHWLKTIRLNNESSWLRSYTEKKIKPVYDFRLNSKHFNNKEDTNNSVNPSTRSAPAGVSKQGLFWSTFEQNSGFNFRESPQGGIKKSIKKLAMNFETIYYKNLLWNSRKITLRILNNAILPLVTNRKYTISNFLPDPEKRIYHSGKLSFYSVQHKTLGTTNFMCSKTYPVEPSIKNSFRSYSSIKIPKESRLENSFSDTSRSQFDNHKINTLNSTLSNQKIEEFSTRLKKQKYNSSLTPAFKSISGGEITNAGYTQKSDGFFSESFSCLPSKWKPFFMGSLTGSQEKIGLPFLDFATRQKQLNEQNDNGFKNESPLTNNLWSSKFFCKYSLYAISSRSDLLFQSLIHNHNWTPSTNKIETPQINSRNYINNLHDSVRVQQREGNRKLVLKNSLINSRVNHKMQLQYKSNNSDQFLNDKPSLKTYYETIQTLLKYQHNKLTGSIVPNYDYYWQKAIHFIVLSRFKTLKSVPAGNQRKGKGFNWSPPTGGYKNLNGKAPPENSFFLQYPKKNHRVADYTSQNSMNRLNNRYSIRPLNSERYFGNPLRRHINQNWSPFFGWFTFGHVLFKFSARANSKGRKLRRKHLKFKPSNQQIKSWKSIIRTVNANIYFCLRYPSFIQNCNLPWQKSKRVFGMQTNWLNRIKVDLKRLSPLNSSTYLSNRLRWETKNRKRVLNTPLVMCYTQLSSSSNKTHQLVLHNPLWTNLILPINPFLHAKGSYGMIGYFTIKESLNSIYKVNYIVESQASESNELAFHSVSPGSTSLTRKHNPMDRYLKPENLTDNFYNTKRFDSTKRDTINSDALTVANFLNTTYTFVPSKTIPFDSFNESTYSQISTSRVENENEYIQIDIWTNGELSPREALLNAFRKLFELFYNLSKYNCLKPIEI